MADECDSASDLTEAFLTDAIEAHRKPVVKMTPTGVCRNCEAPLENPEALFCPADGDINCEAEWRWYKKRSVVQTYEGAT